MDRSGGWLGGCGSEACPARQALAEERIEAEARIPIPTIGIEDPERDPPAGRAGPAAPYDDIGGLSDHVPPQPDPGPPGEFQADARPLPDCGGHRTHESRRLQDEEGDPRPAGECGEPSEPIREP